MAFNEFDQLPQYNCAPASSLKGRGAITNISGHLDAQKIELCEISEVNQQPKVMATQVHHECAQQMMNRIRDIPGGKHYQTNFTTR